MPRFYSFYTTTGSLLSKAVLYKSYGSTAALANRVSHSGLILEPSDEHITPDSLVIEATLKYKGVRFTTLKEVMKRTPHFIATEHNTSITWNQYETALSVAQHLEGLPYDLKGVLGLAANKNWQEDDMFFCSELKAYILKTAGYTGVDWTRYDVHRIFPNDNFSWPQTIIKLDF